jgi:DNA-3-methyladenine glycosylase I
MADWRGGAIVFLADGKPRCYWGVDWEAEPGLLGYHDDEWGTPRRNPTDVFEALSLGIFQAGLGWLTVFHKRDALRAAFHGFDPERVAAMTGDDVSALLENPAIIRNRAKIEATIHNAVLATSGDTELADVIWSHAPAHNPQRSSLEDLPASTPESAALAGALKAAGYKFVGATSVYAFMQSLGVVNDHFHGCYRAVGEEHRTAGTPT